MSSILSSVLLLTAIAWGQTAFPVALPTSIANTGNCTATGPWHVSPSLESTSGWLTVNVNASAGHPENLSMIFRPQILADGNYSVIVYTPGCAQASTCPQRGTVNVTGSYIIGDNSENATALSQTNNFDKYDQIYFGAINASNNSFNHSVKLTPASDTNGIVVAQRVRFEPLIVPASSGNPAKTMYVYAC